MRLYKSCSRVRSRKSSPDAGEHNLFTLQAIRNTDTCLIHSEIFGITVNQDAIIYLRGRPNNRVGQLDAMLLANQHGESADFLINRHMHEIIQKLCSRP